MAHEVFASPRRVRFFEMEYAVPLPDSPAVVREIRELIDRRGWRISFPIEYRSAAADVPLSTAY
ncbi:D-arabinono-1,4-lactone oxidase [uncultured Tessaracoccus sp.]|uniref:D-arabinono-1,4-lactone oxidase n=1 Tax=uncultured Tessaracoccus sp. TaxID=905023 RepID=UPI00342CB185